jgi:glycosyltransferase involved in cell wall biosynthesis
MSALKICICTETYYPDVGGGEKQAQALAEGLAANGFDVIVLTRRSDPLFKKFEQIGNIEVYRLPPVGSEHFKKWGLLVAILAALIKLRRQYDLIFVSGFRVLGIAAVLISKLFGKPCILKADSLGEMSGDFFADGLAKFGLFTSSFPFKLFLRLRNKILKRANAFVAISSEVSAELAAYGINQQIIQAIPNGVDTSEFQPAGCGKKHQLRHKLHLPAHAVIVTYTGRLVSYKGLPLLLRVWREIQCKHNHAKLLLIGSGGLDIHNCEAELKTYVKENNLQNTVQFIGNVQNVNEYLQASDIFVFPTENEAFGISLIEAMSCGLPAIATPVGGVKDILQDKHNGLLVKKGDFRQLYKALDTLLTDAVLSSSLGKSAWQTVKEMYSAEIVTQKYIELFRNAVKA